MTKVLDLGAVFDRDTVKMPDGSTYELRNSAEFGIVEDHKLRTLLAQIDEFRNKDADALTAEDAENASKLLHDLATMLVVGLQQEIPDWACVAIFDFWVNSTNAQSANGGDRADPPGSRRTTAASSPGSKRSTAATRKRGSTSRRGR